MAKPQTMFLNMKLQKMLALNIITFKEQEVYTWFKKEKKATCFGKAVVHTASRQASTSETQKLSKLELCN